MAKYDITYSCGHTETKQLYGKEADRSRYIAWAAKAGTCHACARQDAAAAVDSIEAEHGAVALQGSDKQIAWARKIRADKISAAVAEIERRRPHVKAGLEQAYEDQCAAALTALAGQAAARWWIDERDTATDALLAKALKL